MFTTGQEHNGDIHVLQSNTKISTGHVKLREFYANAKDILVPTRSDLFEPDNWTRVFARGLQQCDFNGSTVLEVGVGVGINAAGLLTSPRPPALFIGTDINENAISASKKLAKEHGLQIPLFESDLLSNLSDTTLSHVNDVIACIPQITAPDGMDLNDSDNSAHYYRADGSPWDDYELGLNNKLVFEATQRAPKARITAIYSGRPGKNILTELFTAHGRIPEVLYEETVHQHLKTSLASLVEKEAQGHEPFEFYGDRNGRKPLSATQAEAIRLEALETGQDQADVDLYHKIYVIRAPGVSPTI